MTNPKRWVEDGAPEGIRELLVAASEEQPKATGAQRTLVALGVGGAVVTGAVHASGVGGATAGAAAAAKGATSASTVAVLMKWGLIGAVGAVTTLGAVHVVLRSPAQEASPAAPAAPNKAPPPSNAAAARVSPPVVTEATEPVPDEVEDEATPPPSVTAGPPAVAPKVAGGSASAQTPPVPSREDSERMLEEVSGIDRARSALARGDARGTLAAIDAYESKFSERRFEPEALYLRMEAFGRLGDKAGETAAAQRLLAAFPNAPQSARAKIVLSGAR